MEFKTLIKRFEDAGATSKESFDFSIINIDDVGKLSDIKVSEIAAELIYDDNKDPKQLRALGLCCDKDKVYYIDIKDRDT